MELRSAAFSLAFELRSRTPPTARPRTVPVTSLRRLNEDESIVFETAGVERPAATIDDFAHSLTVVSGAWTVVGVVDVSSGDRDVGLDMLALELERKGSSGGTVRDGVVEFLGKHRGPVVAEFADRG